MRRPVIVPKPAPKVWRVPGRRYSCVNFIRIDPSEVNRQRAAHRSN